MSDPLGWYQTYHLPHFDGSGTLQFVTFRLADSIPLAQLEELDRGPQLAAAAARRRIEGLLDAGQGECVLRDPVIAQLVEDSLHFGEGERYRLHAWVIMPNHVHVLLGQRPGWPLGRVVQGIKGFTGKEANRLLGRRGPFWQRDYFDTYIRDDRHYANVVGYIHRNPVVAGLVATPELWPWTGFRHEEHTSGEGAASAAPLESGAP